MDASADDPQRFRIRRSPSIGSSAAPVTAASRAGKRKLSTAAFGSSPNMGSHSPSSPITSEHPADGLELHLKQHGLQTASQVASTSRSTLDSPDAARTSETAPNQNVAAHTPFSDWQEQRRCHSILADYDYAQPTEDRRDPRSSNARLVVPVSTQQPQKMVTSAAHDIHSSEARLQPPPIAHRDAEAATLPSGSTICAEATIGNADHRGASAQSALSQSSISVPPSPERGVSPSPSYSDFDYAAQSSRVSRAMPSSLPRPRPETIEEGRLRDLETSPCPAPHASRHAQDDRHSRDAGASQRQSTQATGENAGFATVNSNSWLKMSSVHFDETSECTSVAPSRSTTCDAHGTAPLSQKVFQLQPVPPAKRRRVEDQIPAGTQSGQLSANVVEELRRSSDAGIPFSTAAQPSTIQGSTGVQTDAAVQLSSTKESKHSASHAAAADSVPAPVHRTLGTSSRVNLAVYATEPKKDSMNMNRTNASNRNAHAENASSLASFVHPRKQHASSSRRPARLVRAQSVPNLRAKATLDVMAPSHHRLILPSHWASYVSSHGRTGRDGQNGVAKGSNSRSSKAFPFNVAHYPTATSGSRSRSTFTPTLHPPITRHTLRELDLFEILKNPQLRHDVVFDPNVQFRPNFDGERGRRKREAGERYWTAVVREIETGCTCTAFSHGQLMPCTCKARQRLSKPSAGRSVPTVQASLSQSRIPSRIPLLVQELRTICLSILPSNYPADNDAIESDGAFTSSADNLQSSDADGSKIAASSPLLENKSSTSASSGPALATTHHQLIAQTLDPHLISQELQHGVLDVSALITFMGSILKLHCAPMRDEAIEKMVEVVCVDRNIGKGLRLCFEILELMKLDIANHQLRSARPFLVETAVDFEARWFKEQIEQGKMSLDKTNAWIHQALTTTSASNSASSRSEAVVSAFNHGMLQLIFDVPGSLPVLAPVATPLASPSSSSLNNTFASHYPETFQFDAYRMMTFHNDVSDLTIVYMLVLLFRQLCSTPLDDAGPLPASVTALVQRQLKSIKGEIWCLVNDANLCLSGSSVLPASPTAAANNVGSSSRRSAGLDGKLFLGSAGGFAKLDHPRWRRAMQNVLLQVAARASAVQMAARAGSSDPTTVKGTAPSAATQKLLNSWMDTNFRTGSALHKICQSRLRDVVLSMLSEKVRTGLQPSTSASSTTPGDFDQHSGRPPQKRTISSSHHEQEAAKRSKSDVASGSVSTSTVPPAGASAAAPWDTAMTRAGLEPFSAEIRLLSERIAKVATFHLRVFRNLYEGIEGARHKISSTASA